MSNSFSSSRARSKRLADEMLRMIPEVDQKYDIVAKIGEGTFSKVYMAKMKNASDDSPKFALKYLLPIVKPGRIAKEIRFLRDMRGEANIIPLTSVILNEGHAVIVMPIVKHERFSTYYYLMKPENIQHYMLCLIQAVARIHSDHIVHRDIKPANFLYDFPSGSCALVDFGLSQTEGDIESGMHKLTQKIAQLSHGSAEIRRESSRSSLTKSRINLVTHFTDVVIDDKKTEPSPGAANSSLPHTPFPSVSTSSLPPPTPIKPMKRKIFDSGDDGMASSECEVQPKKTKTPYKLLDDRVTFTISPVTPESKKIVLPVVPETPYKRSPMKELNHESDYHAFSSSVVMNFNQQFKTPVKEKALAGACLETPPKTIRQSNAVNSALNPANNTLDSADSYRFLPILPTTRSLLPPKKILNFQEAPKSHSLRTPEEESPNGDSGCDCENKGQVCFHCYYRLKEFFVPRAGTPGFRAPEVLLRAASQTCKIDVWSVGVVFAAILSGRYPFFRSVDDLTSLAEITELFGSKKISAVASKMDRTFVIDRKIRPRASLREVIKRLRASAALKSKKVTSLVMPDSAYDLLDGLLDPDPESRLSAAQALKHPFFSL